MYFQARSHRRFHHEFHRVNLHRPTWSTKVMGRPAVGVVAKVSETLP